jgi:hypothetical protein
VPDKGLPSLQQNECQDGGSSKAIQLGPKSIAADLSGCAIQFYW